VYGNAVRFSPESIFVIGFKHRREHVGVYYLADSKIFFFNSDILYLVTPRIALEPIIANVRDVYQSNLHYNSLDPFYLAR